MSRTNSPASQPPPHSPEAEQSVLGAVLVRPEGLGRVADLLAPKDFYREAHGRIFQAMLDLSGRGDPVDLVSVSEMLKEKGQLEGVGGRVFLTTLSEQVGFATNGLYYAGLVHDKAMLRRLKVSAEQIACECGKSNGTGSIGDVLDFAESSIIEVERSWRGRQNGRCIIPARELLARDYTREVDIIGNGILPKGGSFIFSGEGGDGKSLIIAQMSIFLVLGRDIWGFPVPMARRVLVLQFENPEAKEAERLKMMLKGLGITGFPADNLMFSDFTLRFDLGEARDRKKLLEIVKESSAEVVIYDPLVSLHSVNENDNAKMRQTLDHITEVNRKTGCSAIVVHHFGKPGENSTITHRTRGASSIRDWADTLACVTRKKHENKTLRLIEFLKVRNGPEPKPILLERDQNFLHHVTEEAILCSPEKVKTILEGLGGTVKGQAPLRAAIIEGTGCGDRRARDFINLAIERQVIRCEPDPQDSRRKIYVA